MNSYVNQVTSSITNAAATATRVTSTLVSASLKTAQSAFDTVGRKVSTFASQNISPRVGFVVEKAFKAMPYTVAAQMLPATVTAPIIFTYAAAHTVMDKEPFSKETYSNIYRGVGNSFLLSAAKMTYLFTKTQNPAAALVATGLLFTSFVCHSHAAEKFEKNPNPSPSATDSSGAAASSSSSSAATSAAIAQKDD